MMTPQNLPKILAVNVMAAGAPLIFLLAGTARASEFAFGADLSFLKQAGAGAVSECRFSGSDLPAHNANTTPPRFSASRSRRSEPMTD